MEINSVGVIGLGYVGLPLIITCARRGYKAIGFDIDRAKIDAIVAGKSYIKHVADKELAEALDNGLEATLDFSKVSMVDAIIICVPTPLNKYREPDLSFILDTMDKILPYIRAKQVISLESTTYPGTTEEEIVPKVEARGFKVGVDYHVIFSPEREDPGNKIYTTTTIPKVVGGHTTACKEVGIKLYSKIIDTVVPVSSMKVAEMAKLLENIHRSVNIGLVNEMKIIADKMQIDIYEVIDAASTKPFGFTPYYPGPGLGGHCIPIDPFYLTWKAKEFGLHTRFIELAGEINSDMPQWVVNKITYSLNEQRKSVKGSKILIIGIAYKKNIDDMRESPAVEVMEILTSLGAEIAYHDDFIPSFPAIRNHSFSLRSIKLENNNVKKFDCVVIVTDHDYINYEELLDNAQAIVDTRGRLRGINNSKITRA